jgi:hypothetical protein
MELCGPAPGEVKMKRHWTLGAVVAVGLGVVLVASPTEGVDGTRSPTSSTRLMGTKTIVIAGKRVVVEVAARRNFNIFALPQGALQGSVYLTTKDGSSLPGISNVKLTLSQGQKRWLPVLAVLPTDVASYRYYVAQGGPQWRVNSTANAKVEIKVGQNTYRVEVPVIISANRDAFVPMPGI